jgi:nitroreductase
MFHALAILSLSVPADIPLNQPDLTRGLVVGQAFSNRHSERSFASTALSRQDLSDLFWSVGGINRPDSGYLVNPTAIDAQDITAYAVLPQGIYRYDKKAHVLRGVVDGDYRTTVADTQPSIANAPVIILIVSDTDAFFAVPEEDAIHLSALDAGIVGQTALLFAAANGFVAVPRAIMDVAKLSALLGLTSAQILHLNVPIGYAP